MPKSPLQRAKERHGRPALKHVLCIRANPNPQATGYKLGQPYSWCIPAGAKAPGVFAALIGPAKAVPLLQSHDRGAATLVLL
jgi:hypothetical protein